jgi:hypothetical protein
MSERNGSPIPDFCNIKALDILDVDIIEVLCELTSSTCKTLALKLSGDKDLQTCNYLFGGTRCRFGLCHNKAKWRRSHMNKQKENLTRDRLKYATAQLKQHNIEFSVKNETLGHLHCRRQSDDKLFQFWAGTGKIMSEDVRGIHNLIKILTTNSA